MKTVKPTENFPDIGTVLNPAVFYDGSDVFICYEASLRAGGGNIVLKFEDVIEFRITPMNVEGLQECRYPVKPWAFNEITGSAEVAKWMVLSPRLWLISFTDVTVEVLFDTVSLIRHDPQERQQSATLIDVMSQVQRGRP